MIAIVDYGVGNLFSLLSSLRALDLEAEVTGDAGRLRAADRIILPGVGAFGDARAKLDATGLVPVIQEEAEKKPLLGICLGMQLLGQSSQEGTLSGLGLLPFSCKRFDFPLETALKIPHMGWDRTYVRTQTPLTEGLEPRERYYYVHSYHAACEDPALVLMECEYGYRFPSAVYGGSVYGVQFHPEKSGKLGLSVIHRYLILCEAAH